MDKTMKLGGGIMFESEHKRLMPWFHFNITTKRPCFGTQLTLAPPGG